MKQEPENIRMGPPYNNPDFEAACREMGIWGTAQAALCAVFWRKGEANMAESIGAGGVSALTPAMIERNTAFFRRMSEQHHAESLAEWAGK